MRYFLFLSYRGTHYHGWQIQNNAVSVQEVVNNALSTILRSPINVTASGRTDTGVHAREQVVHFDSESEIDPGEFVYKLNSLLPKDIAVNQLRPVIEEAHARFSALRREYVYQITTRKDPFQEDGAYYFRRPLDLDKMNDLEDFLLSWKNYQSFSRVKTEVEHFNCDIFFTNWQQEGSKICFTIVANRFLRGMVRAVVGTMLSVGTGAITKQMFEDIVRSLDRREAGEAVPPHGLYLNAITYPDDIYKTEE